MKGHCPHMGSGSSPGRPGSGSAPGETGPSSGAGYPGSAPEVTYQ
jgi:hypothetical protein